MSPAPTARDAAGSDVDAVTDAVLTASRLLMSVSARSIAAVDDTITIPQFRLLVVLHGRGPVKLTAVAEALAVNPSTATRMVERLVATGLVSRDPHPTSRRELVVDLTERGHRAVRRVMRRRRGEISRIVAQMTPTARRNLVRALSAFAAAGGAASDGDDADIVWL
jgi:DNA-binding MarR family transcriptional regulator